MASRTACRYVVLCFADMTESYSLSRFKSMIADADIAVLAFGDVSAVVADDSSGVAFLVDEDSDFFSLFEIFFYTIERQLGKMRSELLGHIY